MKLTVIGCSGSFAGPRSAASSYLLEHTDGSGRTWRVLMDIGSGAFGPLQSVIDPFELDAVVVTHLHPDHYLDLTGLEVYWAYSERRNPPRLPVWAPADLPCRFRSVMSRETDVPDGVSVVPFTHQPLHDGIEFEIGPLAVRAVRVLHPVEAFALRIDDGERTLVYSGDSDACAALDELARGANLYLCEAGYIEGRDDRFPGVHLSGRRAGQSAAAAGVENLVLTHVPPWTDPRIPLAEAREVFSGPLELAEPLRRYDLDAAEPLRTATTAPARPHPTGRTAS